MTDTVDPTDATTRAGRAATVVRKLRSLKVRRLDGLASAEPRVFTVPRIKVGRSRACHLVVAHPSVSALHLELRIRGDRVELRDLGSTNGTRLGDRRVYHVELRAGDRFWVGEVMFELMEAAEVEVPVSADDRFELMWGDSPAIREAFAQLEALARAGLDVLITGETGTGKGLAARSLHLRSGRSGPFVALDCGSLTPHGLELAFERATGGTLLLDHLAELPVEHQPQLLRLLDRREGTEGPGDPREAGPAIDVRVVTTTRADLPVLVAAQRFRADLYFRVAQAVVELPSLRERGDDVELLAARFVAARSATEGGPALELTDEARMALREHRWPGNVRELRNVIQRAISLAHGSRILEADLALHDQGDLMAVEELLTLPYREAHSQLDRYYLRRVMAETRGNITHAAERLGTSRRSLRERLKKLGLYSAE
ncbi:MAG: sigma 54-interacting transcriptional regulator [Myxococcales bacterium]|nr:sigma 54-interacting transcriptional regulator [Myxococcales bacterium]